MIGLNAKNVIQYIDLVSLGTVSMSICHPRESFRLAILKGISRVVMVHNHPSGNCEFSPEDTTLTKRFYDAGELLGIKVLDHIIISTTKRIK